MRLGGRPPSVETAQILTSFGPEPIGEAQALGSMNMAERNMQGHAGTALRPGPDEDGNAYKGYAGVHQGFMGAAAVVGDASGVIVANQPALPNTDAPTGVPHFSPEGLFGMMPMPGT